MRGPLPPRPLGCRLSGPADGPPLVLLHAIGTDAGMWAPQMVALRRAHRVVAVDLPGHGDSAEVDSAASTAAFAAKLAQTLDGLGIARCDLLGLSLGGMVAVAFASAHPERVSRLIACDLRLDAPEDYQALWDRLIARAENEGMAAVAAFMTERWFGSGARAANPMVAEIAAMLRRTPAAGFTLAARAIQALDLLPQAAAIAAPALLLAGSEDGVLPQVMAELAGAMPRAHLEILAGAGHLSNIDQPAAFTAAVLAFLSEPV